MLKTLSLRLVVAYLFPLTILAAIYLFVLVGVEHFFGVTLWERAQYIDFGLTMLIGVCILLMSRRITTFVVLMTLFLALVHISNALKIQILGGPVVPDDLFAVHALFLIMKNWQMILAGGAFLALAALLFFSLTLSTWRGRVGATLLSTIAALIIFVPPSLVMTSLDSRLGNVVWNQRWNYESRGPLLYFFHELARLRAERLPVPSIDDIHAALDVLASHRPAETIGMTAPSAVIEPKRTVVVVLLESFFDASLLKDARFSRDPFHRDFRALWRKTGSSHALSPVFGGYTANAEFEVLCGFPVTMDAVFFEKGLKNDVPCLPRLLKEEGYTSTAYHPNIPAFWNRVNAYRRIGFDLYRSIDDFELDDLNGEFLSDQSLYRQVVDHVGPKIDAGESTFTYVVTFFGHLDYPLNDNREIAIRARNNNALLGRYANTVFNKSKDFIEFASAIQAKDPDALIIAFGDHLPFLGPSFGGYTESGLLGEDRSLFSDQMFRTLTATPLIVVNGKKGPLALGDTPLYELPALVRQLVGIPYKPAPLDLTGARPGALHIRPLPGMTFVEGPERQRPRSRSLPLSICRGDASDPEVCVTADAWLHAVDTISRDLFAGKQAVLGVMSERAATASNELVGQDSVTP